MFPEPPAEDREKLWGIYVALVTDNRDPEGLGRVKVTFPWRGVRDESYWARVLSPATGSECGFFFLPEVGDEVLVAFENGELEHPVILGGLWNGRDKPPYEEGRRLIRSRKGHEILLHDRAGRITLRSAGGREVSLEDDGRIFIRDAGGNEITLTENPPSLKIKGTLRVEIEAQTLRLKGLNIELSADGVLILRGGMVQIN